MADTTHSDNDLKSHSRGYSKFIAMFKWGSIVTFVLTAIVVVLIAS